jgi:hypothetical protein
MCEKETSGTHFNTKGHFKTIFKYKPGCNEEITDIEFRDDNDDGDKKYNFSAATMFVLFETDLTARKVKENLDKVVQVERPPSSSFRV